MPPLPKAVLDDIHLSHAKQLAQFEVPRSRNAPLEDAPPTLFGDTINWINANKAAVQAAQAAQCTSPSPDSPNWDTVFFSLMESDAVYLRRFEEVYDAIVAARAGDLDLAVTHLQKAQEDVDTVAALLDCTFIQLCDFASRSPDGYWYHAGAYCGLFVSNSTSKPFMGVAYKGTSNAREVVTDLDWDPIAPARPGIAWGALVHQGFYGGLFGTFSPARDAQIPFDVMLAQLTTAYASRDQAVLHFTGHSLGGGYCTLTYAEFLRQQDAAQFKNFVFGDMYSYGSPRVCLQPFASQVNSLTQAGGGKYVFRIVNREDPVCTVPPRTASQLAEYPFIHVGGAWKLDDSGPFKMVQEPPPVDPQSVVDIIWNVKNHQTSDYYAGWQKTPHS
ncbi:alpha/beta-hydrolase [Polyporus arcularius HHB13444]|uniref:Alpha/beta-hydrolase n=1 Tax=Polyporus arcularius HHB13444 TaxID=1314778 RepID=A0A5C3NRG8_9APHY|nr:alpha/beta-hydrolase [Polyporus arcularius HHB13444]